MVRRFLGVSFGGDCWSVIEQSEDGQRLFPLCHQSHVRTSRGATLEISQLRSGWAIPQNVSCPGGTMACRAEAQRRRKMPDDSAGPSGRIFVCNQPDTPCLANFRLSLRDDANGADASRFNGFNPRGKPLKRLGFSLAAGHPADAGG